MLAVFSNKNIWQKYVKLSIIKLLLNKLAMVRGALVASNRMVTRY
jgi:hypothetical protein